MESSISYSKLIEELCVENKIPTIRDEVNYWFVRSDSGSLFFEFISGCYIGILWNKITNTQEITSKNEKALRNKYKELYDESVRPGNIFRYHDALINQMKQGDIIVVPSSNSSHFMVGTISGDFYMQYPTPHDEIDENYNRDSFVMKRRPVHWLTTQPIPRKTVDPSFLALIYSQHTIVDANPYSEFINRLIYPNATYYKNGQVHLVIRVNREDVIPAQLISSLITSVSDYCKFLEEPTELKFHDDTLSFEATVNSPGTIEIIANLVEKAPNIATGLLTCIGFISFTVLVFGGKIIFSKHKSIETPGALKSISALLDARINRQKEKAYIESIRANIADLSAEAPAPPEKDQKPRKARK